MTKLLKERRRMYHRIVANKVRSTFAQITTGDWEPMITGMAPQFSYRFYGESALSGERHTNEWPPQVSLKLTQNPSSTIRSSRCADGNPGALHCRSGRRSGIPVTGLAGGVRVIAGSAAR
jgi:hypothetical protein